MIFVIREKHHGRALAQFAHVIGIFVITPAVRRHTADGAVNRFEVGLGTLHDFFRRQGVDWIKRSHIYAEFVRFGTKGTDATRYIQDFFPDKMIRLQEKIAAIFFKRASKQYDAIELQAGFGLDRAAPHPRVRGV